MVLGLVPCQLNSHYGLEPNEYCIPDQIDSEKYLVDNPEDSRNGYHTDFIFNYEIFDQ